MIYVVLGMGKSGTSLVAEILHYSGINMGHSTADLGYDQGNYFERRQFLRLNQAILGTSDIRVKPGPGTLESRQWDEQMRTLIDECNAKYENWGFKDPRTTLLYPMWRRVLPRHRLIAIYRPYQELWGRFRYKGKAIHRRFGRARQLLDFWCYTNQLMMSCLSETKPGNWILLNYQRLMSDRREILRLEKFVQLKLVDRRNPDFYRNRESRAMSIELAARWMAFRTGTVPETIRRRLEKLSLAGSGSTNLSVPPTTF